MKAIVRRPSSRLAEGELTHIDRQPMDVALGFAQHAAYTALLARLGCELIWAPDAEEHPDGLFVEDALVVVGELAILTRPGAPSRRGEPDTIAATVGRLALRTASIVDPGTLDGGDVLQAGSHVFIGRTTRTNDAAIQQMADLLAPLGRTVVGVDVPHCLHLKSAITALPDGSLIAVRGWVDPVVFGAHGFDVHLTDEPSGGDVLCLGSVVVLPADAPATAALVQGLGFDVEMIDVGELQKIEAGVTCMSVLVDV